MDLEPIKRLETYVYTKDGCVDVGVLKFEGYTLVRDEELLALRSEGPNGQLIATLRMAQKALITPQGQFKSKKAQLAFYEIARVMGDPDPWAKI